LAFVNHRGGLVDGTAGLDALHALADVVDKELQAFVEDQVAAAFDLLSRS